MAATKDGWYRKYTVGKVDGSPIDPSADYLVLRLDSDLAARTAALAYADAVEACLPRLAADIRERVEYHRSITDLARSASKGEG